MCLLGSYVGVEKERLHSSVKRLLGLGVKAVADI